MKLSQSTAKIDEVQGKLSNSVPRTELETIRGELQSKIVDLEGKLAASVPKSEADALAEKANRLEAVLTETREKLNSAEAKGRDLELKLTESVPKADAEAKSRELTDRIRELESKLSESVPRIELDAAKAQAESTIRELQGKLSESRSEADALKEKVAGLDSRVAEAERQLETARSRIKELEAAAARPPAEEKPTERAVE